MNANLKAVCFLHAFYPAACVSTHAVVLCDMHERQANAALTCADQQLRAVFAGVLYVRYSP